MRQKTTLTVAAGLALLAFVLMWISISTNLVVLHPLRHLTAVAQRQLKGNLTARVELLPADEFGQLGHPFNILTKTLDHTLKDQDDIIAKRTAQLQQELTERKRAEEALQQAHDELEMRVEKRTAELVKTNEMLHVEILEITISAQTEYNKVIYSLKPPGAIYSNCKAIKNHNQ